MTQNGRRVLYIVVRRDVLSFRYIIGNDEVARLNDVPQVAFQTETEKVVAGGRAASEWAQMPGYTLFRAFNHPHVAVCDARLTAWVMDWFYQELKQRYKRRVQAMTGVIHWMESELGTLTPLEHTALTDLCARFVADDFDQGVVAFCDQADELDFATVVIT